MKLYATLLIFCLVLYSVQTNAQVTSTGCGTTKGCFQNPTGCDPTTASCQFVSWIYDATTQTFTIELSGASSGNYVAMAFTAVNGMANGDGYICTGTGTNQLISTTIASQTEPIDDGSLPTGVSLTSATTANGFTQCTFTRPASVIKSISGSSITFDLSTNSYYLLVAGGATDSGSNSIMAYHAANKEKSGLIDFTTSTVGTAAGIAKEIKAHAALMALAWMFLAHFGMLVARFYKPTWPQKKINGAAIWFQIHRGAMITVFLLTIIGFIIIFAYNRDFVPSGTPAFTHAIMGIVVTAFVIINPTMATFRPHPGTKNRWIFNIAHTLVGISARILAVVTMFFGRNLAAIGLSRWTLWVLVAFVCVHGVSEITLEVMKCTINKTGAQPENIDMANQTASSHQDVPEPHARTKTIVLICYGIINGGLTIAMLVGIGLA